MSKLLRKVRQGRWLDEDAELLADPLADLNTHSNELSVYEIQADEANLTDVIVGLASGRDSLVNVDYILIDRATVEAEGFILQVTRGATPYKTANDWHMDIVGLTARRLVELAELMKAGLTDDEERRLRRVQRAAVRAHLEEACRHGTLDRQRLDPRLKKHINPDLD